MRGWARRESGSRLTMRGPGRGLAGLVRAGSRGCSPGAGGGGARFSLARAAGPGTPRKEDPGRRPGRSAVGPRGEETRPARRGTSSREARGGRLALRRWTGAPRRPTTHAIPGQERGVGRDTGCCAKERNARSRAAVRRGAFKTYSRACPRLDRPRPLRPPRSSEPQEPPRPVGPAPPSPARFQRSSTRPTEPRPALLGGSPGQHLPGTEADSPARLALLPAEVSLSPWVQTGSPFPFPKPSLQQLNCSRGS